jgi:hypothetical protein
MSTRYEGTSGGLEALLDQRGVAGEWIAIGEFGKHTFCSQKGGVPNFWHSKGVVQCQGKAGPKAELEALLIEDPLPHSAAV